MSVKKCCNVYLGKAKPSSGGGGGGGGAVDSVNGKTGVVVLDAKDVHAVPQLSTIPQASAQHDGEIVQYSGATNASYTNGYFYKCSSSAPSYDATVSFAAASISGTTVACSGSDFAALVEEWGSGQIADITKGTLTYDESGGLLVFVGKDDNDTTITTFQLYTQDYEDAGFTITGTLQDGDVINFTCTITETLTYAWDRIDVQPAGGGAVNSVNGQTGNVVLTANDLGALERVETMPTPDASSVGKYVMYVGASQGDYTNGFVYKGTESSGTYSWTNVVPYDTESVVIGKGASSLSRDNVVVGKNALASQYESIAVGDGAMASSAQAIAIGKSAFCGVPGGVVIGNNVELAFGANYSIAIGNVWTRVDSPNCVMLNGVSRSTGGIAIGGGQIYENATTAIAMGDACSVFQNSTYGIAMGQNSNVGQNAPGGIAIGHEAWIYRNASNAVQIGQGTNYSPNSFKFLNWEIINNQGKLNNDRLPDDVQKQIAGSNPPSLNRWIDESNGTQVYLYLGTDKYAEGNLMKNGQWYRGSVAWSRPNIWIGYVNEDWLEQSDVGLDSNTLFAKFAQVSQERIDDGDVWNSVVGGDNSEQDMTVYYTRSTGAFRIEFQNNSIESADQSTPDSIDIADLTELNSYGITINGDLPAYDPDGDDEIDIFDIYYYAPVCCDGFDSASSDFNINYMKFMTAMCNSTYGFPAVLGAGMGSWNYTTASGGTTNTYSMPLLPEAFIYNDSGYNTIDMRFEWDSDNSVWIQYMLGDEITTWTTANLASTLGIIVASGDEETVEYIDLNWRAADAWSWQPFFPVRPELLPGYDVNANQCLSRDANNNWQWKAQQQAVAVELEAANWSGGSQTVNVTGVTASNSVIISPAPASTSDYTTAGILCTAQGAGTLTFTASTTPLSDIDVNVLIFE